MTSPKGDSRETFLDDGFHLPKIEEKVLAFWDTNHIFEKTVAERASGKTFVFYEGPPYANGKPGIHHVLARVVKDIILRYRSMRGFFVPRRAGWDTHGLPVEIAAEKALGLASKADIEKYGVKLFNEKAREAVWTYKDDWERLTKRIGYWLDLTNAYVTYTSDYIETIWWSLKQLWEKKLLYKGHRVVPWCSRCGTALSSHELALGYKEIEDQSVYIKFRLVPGQRVGKFETDQKSYILSWTTTPWTLPGNVALAVGKDIVYDRVFDPATDETFFVAQDLLNHVFVNRDIEVKDKVPGVKLVGLRYEPLFAITSLATETAYKIYPANFVTTTDGTGVVHTAVMYGEDDFALGAEVGLPQRHTVTEEGRFTDEVNGLEGLAVKDAATEKKIFDHLQAHHLLFRTEGYTHEYPFCWRCGTPVLYYARVSWFIAMSTLREKLLAANRSINWYPAHVKDGRFGEWLREVKDWNLSRERYWGAPLPIWECGECHQGEIVGSMAELDARAGGARNTYWTMRHGEAESNIKKVLDAGEREFHLTTMGRDQVKTALAELKKHAFDLIVASDITRTKETAELVAEGLGGLEIRWEPRLREIKLGRLAGLPDKEYHALFPTLEDRFVRRPEGGESVRDLRARVAEVLRDLEHRYAGKNILLVAHEYPIWMLNHVAQGWTEKRAIEEKKARGDDFVRTGGTSSLPYLVLPRNDHGEVDLHRPFVDDFTYPCSRCHGSMRRIKEVADVWYDSGAMPLAQNHYPFENKDAVDRGTLYPADYIAEGVDQTRGWFYTLLAIATALGKPAPYKNVVCLELINDKYGQKMSKSKGNIVEPFTVIDKYGVDAVRWYFFTGTPLGEPKNFDEAEVGKAFRRFHLLAYNSLVFYRTYAVPGSSLPKAHHVLDRWILARLAATIETMTAHLEGYAIREAALTLEALGDDLSRWYIRRSRRRFQRPASAADHAEASHTLRYVLMEFAKLAAPFTPFFAETLYHALREKSEPLSVHLALWPAPPKGAANPALCAVTDEVRVTVSSALAKRAELGIKVRQPLRSATVKRAAASWEAEPGLIEAFREEVNVKEVLFDPKAKEEVVLDTTITPELKAEGLLRELTRVVQDLRQEAGLRPGDEIVLMLETTNLRALVAENEKFLRGEVGAHTIEYKKEDKFDAELETKLDGEALWVAVRKK